MIENWDTYESLADLKKKKFVANKAAGYLYIVEYGEFVKIGVTINPIERISTINSMAVNYAGESVKKIVLSKRHVNYMDNERYLHVKLGEFRIENGELFKLTIDEVLDHCVNLSMQKSEKEIVNDEIAFRNKVLDNYFAKIEEEHSNRYHDDVVYNIIKLKETDYYSLIVRLFGNEIPADFYASLNDFDFVKLILIGNLINNYIENDMNYFECEEMIDIFEFDLKTATFEAAREIVSM